MSKNRIQHIIIHESDGGNLHTLADRVSEFHANIIERRLNQSSLSAKQKIAVNAPPAKGQGCAGLGPFWGYRRADR